MIVWFCLDGTVKVYVTDSLLELVTSELLSPAVAVGPDTLMRYCTVYE